VVVIALARTPLQNLGQMAELPTARKSSKIGRSCRQLDQIPELRRLKPPHQIDEQTLFWRAGTKILFGDPSRAGFYAIVLSVPPNTTVPAHSHRDDRMATVVSGTWQFGYGDRFDASALKVLPPGSVYSEPGGGNHFARTGAEPVLVQISGVGPSDTRYVDPATAPKAPSR
jgi:quercetin dioxygenase-like cupin family protein